MQNKKIICSSLAIMLTASLLTGCGASETASTVTEEPTKSVIASNYENENTSSLEIDKFDTQPEPKVYQEYEHLFMARYNLDDETQYVNLENINGVSIPIPEGYEVVTIQNFNSLGSRIGTTETYGVDIWYTNVVPVEVYPVYNEAFSSYDYSLPGKVLPKENVIDTDKTLDK